MADAFIIDACRTPRGIGKQGKGALAHLHPQHQRNCVARCRSVSGLTPLTLTTSSGAPAPRSVSSPAISAACPHSMRATTFRRAG